MARTTQAVEVDGRVIALSNLEKVLYPATGTTKAEVLHYYTQVAPALLPLVAGRPVTRKRWPDGVQGEPFFEKNAPNGTPPWRKQVQHDLRAPFVDRRCVDAAEHFLELHFQRRCLRWLVVELDAGARRYFSGCV